MESTGGSASKSDKKENTLPKEAWRFIPSISDQGLD